MVTPPTPAPAHARYDNERTSGAGLLSAQVDFDSGVIRVEGTGLWSLKQVKDHFTHIDACIRDIHGARKTVAAIIDLRQAAPQPQDVYDMMKLWVRRIYSPADRVALVVPNSLVKMQMRRLIDVKQHEFFLSMNAAETWAMAHRRGIPMALHA